MSCCRLFFIPITNYTQKNHFYCFCRNELLTLKHCGRRVLNFMRTQKFDDAWQKYFAGQDKEKSLFEGLVLISILGQVNQKEMPSLTKASRFIDEVASRVTELVRNCSKKSSRRTLVFINQVLYEEMGFQGIAHGAGELENFFIDKVEALSVIVFLCSFLSFKVQSNVAY